MPEPVFEASGHLDGFDDMLVECAECGESHRADHLIEDNSELEDAETLSPEAAAEKIADLGLVCPTCGADLVGQSVEDFNLMFETNIGPGSSTPGYLRPETAQGIFVEFPRIKEYARNSLPFGVTQVGRAYRNEISPRKSIVRTREFTQAELEHFIDPEATNRRWPRSRTWCSHCTPPPSNRPMTAASANSRSARPSTRISSRASGSPTTSASPKSGTSASASTWTASGTASTSRASAPTTPRTAGTPKARSTATG